MLGFESVGELSGRDVRSLVPDAVDLQRAAELVNTGETGEIRLLRSDGEPVWAQVMGLGLYVVQKLAELMGGSVAATSRNGYTEFCIELPAADVPARTAVDA